MVSLLLLGRALAGVVTDVPPGEHQVALVVCPTEDPCSTEIFRVEASEPMPMLLIEVVLELDAAGIEGGETQEAHFTDAMEHASAAISAKRWGEADIALDDAEAALSRWSGTVENQRLFDLHYLRGAVQISRGQDATRELRGAAAVAWNREVKLPVPDPVAGAYYEAMRGLVAGGTGTLRLAAPPPDASWYLDGIELGDAAAVFEVFPGDHRVTARGGRSRAWKRDVRVEAGQVREVSARTSRAEDPRWVEARIRAAFDGGGLPPEVLVLLSDWCARKDVHQLRLMLVGKRPKMLDYDPQLRRVSRP